MDALPFFLFLSVAVFSVFSFVAVVVWSVSRRREREAYYRSEALKKIGESQGTADSALEFLREEQKNVSRRGREAAKESGMVLAGVGIGMMVFLRAIIREEPIFLAGLMPLFIGLGLLAYSYLLAPRE